ncbi:MAG: hypothetical protein K2X81_08655 [Candidatus Obscuribacterales bacterium]|nr:hypothetical protein [Candidatus Obscuribacterales bacterium]
MNSKQVLVMVGAIATGLLSPMAMADPVNEYFSTPMTQSTLEITNSSPVVIERDYAAPVVIEKTLSSPVVVERIISTPVMIQKTGSPPVLLEDRIIKQKHKFGMGIWPIFDFEVL